MVDARESLGEFESSIFDASDGHKLVDLIRRKKGLHVQTQKIFDDVPSQRPSLQIAIQRLDEENETLQPDDRLPQEPVPAAIVNEVPPVIEFVPKSPARKSIARTITSPIIKMNSTTLGRRTLLKEFEKAFLNESRFNPEICSTPITSDVLHQINHKDKNDSGKERMSEKESPEENIIGSPITISDEGSPADDQTLSVENQTLKESYTNTENMMRNLINQNKLLNALVQQSQEEEPDGTYVNRDNFVIKSPRRTFTVQRDISTGKITLSPAKSRQNTEREPKALTRNLVSTPEQIDLFKKLGLGLAKSSSKAKSQESPQKSSRIPILSKATTVSAQPCLTNQESTTTAEFVERLQKNATPNCPVIVIPVNQTFNQAPTTSTNTKDSAHVQSPPLNEITSTISDNTPKATDFPSRQTPRKPTRIESPASNVISSTTISNGEQQKKDKEPSPPINNLRWDDIITDDASSSDKSNSSTQRTALENKRNKILNKKKSKKQHSSTYEKNKLSLSYKCLDLRLRIDSDEERENNIPQKSQRLASDIEQRRTKQIKSLPQQSRHREECQHNLHRRSRRGTSNIDENYCEHGMHQRSRQEARISEKCDKELEQNFSHRSQRKAPRDDEQCNEERENNFQNRSRRRASKIDDLHHNEHNLHQRVVPRKSFKIAEQCDNVPNRSRREFDKQECNLQQRSQRTASKIDKQFNKDCEHDLLQQSGRVTSRIVEHSDEESEENLSLRSLQEILTHDKQSNEERENSLPRLRATETDERCEGEREQTTSQRKMSHTKKQLEKVYKSDLPQRSRQEGSEIVEQQGNEIENNLQLPTRRRTSKYVEEHENNLPHRSLKGNSVFDNQCDEEPAHNSPNRSGRESSEIDEQPSKQAKPNRSASKTSKNDDQPAEQRKKKIAHKGREENFQSQQKSNLVEQCHKDLEHSLLGHPRRNSSKSVPPLKATETDKQYEENSPQQSEQGSSEADEQPHITRQRSPAKTSKNHEQRCEKREKKVSHKGREDSFQQQSQQKSSNIVEQCHEALEQSLTRRSRQDISKIDEQISVLRHTIEGNNEIDNFERLPPPAEFRDSHYTNSITLEKDLVDEDSSERVVLSQGKFKRPHEVIKKKRGRKTKILPEVREYLKVNQSVGKMVHLNMSKRKLYSKGNSDLDSSDDSSYLRKQKMDKPITTQQKSPCLSRKSAKSVSRSNFNNSEEQTTNENSSKSSDNDINNKELKQMRLSRSRRKVDRSSLSLSNYEKTSRKSKEHSDRVKNTNTECNIDTNIAGHSSSSNIAKSSGKTKKMGPKFLNKDVASDNQKRSISPASSRSRSPPKISRNSRKTHKSRTKTSHRDVESNLEEDISDSTSKSRSLSKKTAASPSKTKKAKKTSKKSNALNSVDNQDVEANVEKNTAAPTFKSHSKKKISKQTSEETSSIPSIATTSSEHSECGPRRSKRETKQPSAYWACGNSEYTHAYDIYAMFTAKMKSFNHTKPKEKNKKRLPSTDDNLVANTNTVDSSSKKNKNKPKEKTKEKNKKVGQPKTIDNREFQSDSETELRRPNVSSAAPSELAQLPEPSRIENPASSVPAVDKISSRIKSKQKTKKTVNSEDLENANPSEQYSSSNDLKASDSSVKKRRLTTITENDQMVSNNQRTTSGDVIDKRSSETLMPPPKTNMVKKTNKTSKTKTFYMEHDESIADVSSVHVNNLFDQLKNSSMKNTTVNRTQIAMNSRGQVSLDNRSSKTRNPNSEGKTKNVSVRLQRLNLHQEGLHDKHFDSGFSSEDMNSINTRKDILLDWLVKMLNKGKPPNKQKGLARFLQPNGFSIANADDLTFEEIDGVDFAFYNSPGQKFGYLRFHPRTQKKLSCAKRYELNFILLGGTIQMTVDRQTFEMKNGDLTTIFIGTKYLMKNITDDPALVMVIRN